MYIYALHLHLTSNESEMGKLLAFRSICSLLFLAFGACGGGHYESTYSVQYMSYHLCYIPHSSVCITALATQRQSCSPRRCPRPVFVYDACVSSQARSIEVLTEAHARTHEGRITYPCDGVLRVACGEPCERACGKTPHKARRPVSCCCVSSSCVGAVAHFITLASQSMEASLASRFDVPVSTHLHTTKTTRPYLPVAPPDGPLRRAGGSAVEPEEGREEEGVSAGADCDVYGSDMWDEIRDLIRPHLRCIGPEDP